jgi:hypothetical protein
MLALLLALGGLLQDPLPPPSAISSSSDPPAIAVRVEQRAERFDYHFDNPSNFEPGPLVPHFFEQRYESGNTWVLVEAAYRIAGTSLTTEVGLTPRITTFGSDIDTFFQPSGDVITSGTRGDVRLRSFALRQRIALSSWRRWTLGVTIGYRRTDMDYLPSDRIVTHRRPPSEVREPVAGNENTWSHVLESGFMAGTAVVIGPRWLVTLDLDALPITRARLNVSLPDKYPGEISRADAFSFGAQARLAAARKSPRLSAGAAITLGGAWGYRSTAHYHARHAGGQVFLTLPVF